MSDEKEITGATWMARIEAAEEVCKTWKEETKIFTKLYYSTLDKYHIGDFTIARSGTSFRYRNNIFANNINMLMSALLPELPKIFISKEDVEEAKFDEMLEETISITEKSLNEIFGKEFGETFKEFKKNLLVCGSGILWVDVVLDNEEPKLEINNVGTNNFYWSPAQKVEDIWWVARRIYMSKERALDVLGSSVKELKYNDTYDLLDDTSDIKTVDAGVCEFYEVWDKNEKVRFYITKQSKRMLDVKEDYLNLKGFFPVVFPATFNSNEMLVPVPEGRLILNELIGLQVLESRIENLITNIKSKAYFDNKFADAIKESDKYEEGTKYGININKLDLQGRPISELFFFEPIETFAQSLEILSREREILIDKIRELSGVADIMAMNVSEDETATATIQKGRFGSIRLRNKQSIIINYLVKTINIAFEILCSLSSLKEQYDNMKIEIETYYDIDYNINNEQQKGLQLFDLVIKNSDIISSISKASGNVAQLLSNVLQIAITPFVTRYSQRIGIEKVMDNIIQQSTEQVNQEEVQSAEMVAAQAEQMKGQAELLKAQVAEKNLQIEQLKIELERMKIESKNKEIEQKYDIEQQKIDTTAAIGTAKTIIDGSKE